MMDIRDNILNEEIKICGQKKVNFSIFSKNFLFKHKKEIIEIRKEYFGLLNSFFEEGSIYRLENELGLPEKTQERKIENILLCFRGIFRKFLESIIERYDKNIWGIQKSKKRKHKNFSKRKMCLG